MKKTKSTLPKFTFTDVKYAADQAIFYRALNLFESKKVGLISEDRDGYFAQVQGTELYDVGVPFKSLDRADCTCYMGQRDEMCKHILALALAVLDRAGVKEEKAPTNTFSDLSEVKAFVTKAMRHIKPYHGPSKIWFKYQAGLSKGSCMIADAIENLEPSPQNAKYVWSLVKRLDQKLLRGVDDSDGFVSGGIMRLVEHLVFMVRQDKKLSKVVQKFCDDATEFDFHLDLKGMLEEELSLNS